jgi:hypothetical protein
VTVQWRDVMQRRSYFANNGCDLFGEAIRISLHTRHGTIECNPTDPQPRRLDQSAGPGSVRGGRKSATNN